MEVRWSDSDDGERMSVQLNNTAQHATISLKMTHPIRITQDDVWSAVWTLFIRGVQQPPDVRLNANRVEVIPTDPVAPCRRRASTGVNGDIPDRESRQI